VTEDDRLTDRLGMTADERFMNRALELAAEPPFTSPNPRVGAVIVRDGEIVAEGKHEGSGTPHAEARALEGTDARGATLYVTLEPCVHHGKMPPCVPTVLEAGISRVVAAIGDPDERVAGKGFDALRAAGIEVVTGVCALAAARQNRAYLHHRSTRRPLVTLKLALSLDGKIAAPDGSSKWITGEMTRRRVHARRLEADAILVGAGTVLLDDPSLTVRDVAAPRQPVRVVCDATGRIPATSKVFGPGEVIVMTTISAEHPSKTRWKEAGAEVVVVGAGGGGVDLDEVVENLGGRGWIEVYCEGGATLATSLLREDLVDVLELNYGPILIGGDGIGLGELGVTTMGEASRWRLVDFLRMGQDTIVELERQR
jgi:diaminohydroxyphosphoribosylaminopyrimidine deaminase / 5-amino-6-(5-phosphoribosylamino)uracil reductase